MFLYEPAVRWTCATSALSLAPRRADRRHHPAFLSLGSEFMPPMDEGAILYMPTTLPGISIAQAQRVLQSSDMVLSNS